jgi:hypothetical protein
MGTTSVMMVLVVDVDEEVVWGFLGGTRKATWKAS